MPSKQPRKQRKALYSAPQHKARKQVSAHLAEDLLVRYNRRSLPVVVGDEVKIMRGSNSGHRAKVVTVDVKHRRVVVDGVTHKKADGTDVALPVAASNLLITRLNLEDKRRRAKLGETAEPTEKEEKAAKKEKAATEAKEARSAKEGPAAPAAKEAAGSEGPPEQPSAEAAGPPGPSAETVPEEKAEAASEGTPEEKTKEESS